jgi:capsid protein
MDRLKMLIKYDATELEAAIVNAIFSAYIESPFDHSFVEDALGDCVELTGYQRLRSEFHEQRRLMLGGVRIPTLFTGEKINAVSAVRPTSNFRDFEGAAFRNVAACLGVSSQQLSQDWSDVNYSSARGPARSVEDAHAAARGFRQRLRLSDSRRFCGGSLRSR